MCRTRTARNGGAILLASGRGLSNLGAAISTRPSRCGVGPAYTETITAVHTQSHSPERSAYDLHEVSNETISSDLAGTLGGVSSVLWRSAVARWNDPTGAIRWKRDDHRMTKQITPGWTDADVAKALEGFLKMHGDNIGLVWRGWIEEAVARLADEPSPTQGVGPDLESGELG